MIRALRDREDPAEKVKQLISSSKNTDIFNDSSKQRTKECSAGRPYVSTAELRDLWRGVAEAYTGGGEDSVRLDPEDESVVKDALWILETQGEIFSSGGLSKSRSAAFYTAANRLLS